MAFWLLSDWRQGPFVQSASSLKQKNLRHNAKRVLEANHVCSERAEQRRIVVAPNLTKKCDATRPPLNPDSTDISISLLRCLYSRSDSIWISTTTHYRWDYESPLPIAVWWLIIDEGGRRYGKGVRSESNTIWHLLGTDWKLDKPNLASDWCLANWLVTRWVRSDIWWLMRAHAVAVLISNSNRKD